MRYRVKITRSADIPELGHITKGDRHEVGEGVKTYLVQRSLAVVEAEIADPEPAAAPKPEKAKMVAPQPPPIEAQDTVTGALEPVKTETGKK